VKRMDVASSLLSPLYPLANTGFTFTKRAIYEVEDVSVPANIITRALRVITVVRLGVIPLKDIPAI